MAGIGALVANIVTTFDPKGINNAKRSILGLTDASVSASKKQKIAMGLIGGAFAAAGVAAGAFAIKIGRDGVRAAIDDQKSLSALNKTLLNLGYGTATESVDKFINSLQFSTGVSDDELRPALSRLVVATGDLTQAQQLLTLSQDISAGTGKDLESVTSALSKAALGQTTALSRLGVGLDKTILATGDLDKIQSALNQKFSGQAQVAANTYAGRLQILTRGVDEAKEAIGYGLLDALDNVSEAIGTDASGLASQTVTLGEYFGDVARGAGEITANLINVAEESSAAGKTFSWAYLLPNTIELLFGPLIDLTNYLNGVGEAARIADYVPKYGTMHQARIARQNKLLLDQISKDEETRKNAEAEAEKKAAEATRERERALKELEAQQKRVNKVSQDFAKFMAGTGPETVQGASDLATKALSDMKNELGKTKNLTAESVDKFDEFSNIIQSNFSTALNLATAQLDEAKNAFTDFKNSITSSITGTINFASAIEETDFLTGLQAQASKAIQFSDRVNKLLTLGLSERGIQQVLSAGADAGIAIADQIIAGGSTVVNKVNELLSSVQTVADQVVTAGAQLFYDAGVIQGQSLVDGIRASIASAAGEIAGLAASLVGAAAPVVAPVVSGVVVPPKKTPTPQITPPPKNPMSTNNLFAYSYTKPFYAPAVKRFADGGIVTGPTNALIGEAGPEAVIPLSGSKSGALGATYNIVVNAGVGTNGAQVGQQIVEAIKKYERTSGQVFARA